MPTYLLIIEARQPTLVQIGARGTVSLAAGYYLYVGSAKRGLTARIARHYRQVKKRHWHLDYLLSRPEFQILEVWLSDSLPECDLARTMLARPEVWVLKPGLGASDCRCPAHFLVYQGNLRSLERYLPKLGLYLYVGKRVSLGM
ncbi:MAG: GIY-YIG nuclease family protein [Deltaproteobacteria bacterium]|nr:GIY-YIG nuclease family protein [Deltaproteobacteria bacterium]MBW1986097.1 GIY-YIG nuclease family protein [Deltaproteobacteria bacterium]MBW2134217.1 GIY-YIG nuclease family protein [Deltaproteobacteria bacterium]